MNPLAPDRWTEVDALFDAALQRPPDERTAFLRATCGDDPLLYGAVAALLESDAAAAQALGESATEFAARLLEEIGTVEPDTVEDLVAGTRLGPYRIVGELGRGGMGTVYRAERADGTFEKGVALKLVKRGMDTDEVLRRFRYERQVLAGLDHPGIARLLDAGAAPDGRPYLVMELVEGEPLTRYAETRDLDLEARLALFEQACEAVAYAHHHLVVHRDLKPSNMLVAEDKTGQPRVKLLDFGIAKLLNDDENLLTRLGGLMTPEYAAPEQREGGAVTTATDVYALGVVLHELLAGQRPTEPGRAPSDAVEDDRLRRRLRGDLDTLLLTALHDEPGRRYASADALLADVRRRRRGLPLIARPDTVGYRLRKFVERHRWGVGAAAMAAIALVVFAVFMTLQQRQTAQARDSAATAAAFLESLFAATDPFAGERQDTLRLRDLLDPGLVRVRAEFADQPDTQAQLLHVIGEAYLNLGLYPEAEDVLREAVLLRPTPSVVRATSLNALATALLETGALDESESAAREAHRLAAEAGDAALLTRTERQQALALTELGRSEEAEVLLRDALDRLRRSDDAADAPAIAEAEETLARVLINQGRVAEAEAAYRAALDRYERLYGADDPRRLGVLRHLSFVLLMGGRLEEAETVGAEAVALTRAVRPGSGSLANILAVYGAILRRQGRLHAAEAALREAAMLPPRRPADRAVPLGTLASVLQEQGDLDGAIAAQREALTVLQESRGSTNTSAVFSAVKLAGFLREQRRFEQAEELLLELDAALSNVDSSSANGALQVATELAALYEAWGR
ncbi:MAG: serine/threonine protein kinase [Rhodothermaceae bacterium]|nr:serine/threonine protein kinase [Rhodothermaceae bacterium]